MTTNRQKAAVQFCEETLGVTFTGRITSAKDVSDFLYKHLKRAKIKFCEEMFNKYTYLQIHFTGDVEINKAAAESFIAIFWNRAKEIMRDINYEAEMSEAEMLENSWILDKDYRS